MNVLLSLLIPTLEARRTLFLALWEHLRKQIQEAGLDEAVEILSLSGNGEKSIGAKRNELVEQARGEFIAFIDDDDLVSHDYVSRICDAIRRRPDIDCAGIRGLVTFRGKHAREFVHSLAYRDYFSRGGRYYRPPCHLNPIRRSIAERYRFAELSYSEDIDWALRIQRDGALKTEEFVDATLYHYRSRRWWYYQWLLDRTERLRHALGLRFSNRLRWYWLMNRRPARRTLPPSRHNQPSAKPALSVIIPVYNAENTLGACLRAVGASRFRDFELIVADDGSTDRSAEVARSFPCTLVSLQTNAGPAAARNAGVAHSSGELLFFLDADVLVAPQALGEVVRQMSEHPDRDAVFGSFAGQAAAPGFFSDYKNLLHHYTHQHSRCEAATFCGGFGAIRRDVFLALGGFDPRWRFLEDVELGYRLHRAGGRIWLSKELEFQHAKRYTLSRLIRSDLLGRAIPWTRLMLMHRIYRNDLNTRANHLLSVPISYALLAAPAFGLWPALLAPALFLLLNRGFLEFVLRERGFLFCLGAAPTCWLGYLVSGVGFLLGALAYWGEGMLRSVGLARAEPEA
jgi:glycosyltransferase involved in cell wall biosynthesis